MITRLVRKPPAPVPPLSDDEAARLADMFRLLGDPSRLRILLACLAEPTNVGAIAGRAGLSVSLVSHHLRLLRAARLVRATRQGKQVFYEGADAHVRGVIQDMVTHLGEPDGEDEEHGA
ncbi:MAG: winged helix-turn-helix transcriptional regulator [Alphaproteobacteria bacterium]|nr:winged helix-turn-helix transcriptional regulator [Alphaproteobacteria bacterium]